MLNRACDILNDIPIQDFRWFLSEPHKRLNHLQYTYRLRVGHLGFRSSGILINKEHTRKIQYLLDWSLKHLEPLKSYKIIGYTITPHYEITFLSRQFIGTAPFEAAPPRSYRINLIKRDHTGGERIDPIIFYEKDLPNEINEILSNIDDLIWSKIRDDIIKILQIPEKDIPVYLSKHVFIVYRDKNKVAKSIAEKLYRYLREEKGIRVWYFPWIMSLGDSVTEKEDLAIADSFGAIICLSPDLLNGKTAREEYNALIAKRRYNKLRLILVLVNCSYDSIPPFLLDTLKEEINTPEDPEFNEKAEKIFRGLLGLPIKSS